MKRRRRKKRNLITSIAFFLSLITLSLLPLPVTYADNFTVSKSNVNIEEEKTSTITINAPTHTGRLDIITSNSEIATVNENMVWVENNSKTITISAKAAGNATITIKGDLYDSSMEEEVNHTKTIKVTVTKKSDSNSNSTGATANGSNNEGNNSSGTQAGNISNSSGIQNSNKPTTGSSSNSSSSKPSSSTVSTSDKVQQSTTNISETITEEIGEKIEEITEQEEISEEVAVEEMEPNINAEIIAEEHTTYVENEEIKYTSNSKLKIIISVVIGFIAIVMILIGIGVSKNILKNN